MKLYGVKDSSRTQKVLVSAEYVGVKVDCPPFVPGKDDKTADFRKKSPLGRTPVLETPKGCIVGSGAITRFLARLRGDLQLYGESFQQHAEVDMWVEISQNELEVPLAAWVYPALGLCPGNKEATARAKEDVSSVLRVLDNHLLNQTFLVGEGITLADISVAIPLAEAYKIVFDEAFMKQFPNVERWFLTCVNQKNFSKIVGSVTLPGGGAQAAAPAAATRPKAQSEEADEDAPPPKKHNPLDDLPETKMVMDEWKRTYSNTKELQAVAMKWFWENYDPSGYSIWYTKYQKLPTECTIDFVTANLLNGFLQRFEGPFRKYSFGVLDVVGKDKSFDIQGVWMFRGLEIPAEIKEHPSYEYYTFKKLNPIDNPQDKKLVEEYWCSMEQAEGLPITDRKVWK